MLIINPRIVSDCKTIKNTNKLTISNVVLGYFQSLMLNMELAYQKTATATSDGLLAGAVGIEPTLKLLESLVQTTTLRPHISE